MTTANQTANQTASAAASAAAIAFVTRELEQFEARDKLVHLTPRRARRKAGCSTVFSVRLDPEELGALEARAAIAGIGPTVLARNLIRTGLLSAHGAEIASALDRLEAAVAELRAAAGP